MWFNPIVRWFLRSPLHFLMSKHTLLMTYTGRRSGHRYTTPMNYLRSGDEFYITSLRTHTWWRNLRGQVAVELRVQGKDLQARAEVIEDETAVADQLMVYFSRAPRLARLYGVKHDARGTLDAGDLLQTAQKMVIVKATLMSSEENDGRGKKGETFFTSGSDEDGRAWERDAGLLGIGPGRVAAYGTHPAALLLWLGIDVRRSCFAITLYYSKSPAARCV